MAAMRVLCDCDVITMGTWHNANQAKFNKVAAMAWTLLDSGRVSRSNGDAFFIVLEAGDV